MGAIFYRPFLSSSFLIFLSVSSDFKYIKFNNDNIHFSDFLTLKNIESMLSHSTTGYDFSKLTLELSNAKSSELDDYLATLNTVLIETKCNSIDNKVSEIIEISESFEQFKQIYLNFVEKELANVQSQDEYTYIRIFADIYLSTIEYMAEYLSNVNPTKGKFWDALKEGWNAAKPVVGADVGGAVSGALVGLITGPGVVATGMSGACGASAGYCIGQLFQ